MIEPFYFTKEDQRAGVVADFSFTTTDLESFLSAISSIAVIAGAVFVVFQLRQNARQIKQHEKTLEAMSEANRSHNAFELIGKVIDPSFPVRRHRLYEVSEKYSAGDWTGFDRSLDDFEVRNFANIYEQLGLLVRKGVIDLRDVMDALPAQPMADWLAFQPLRGTSWNKPARRFPRWQPIRREWMLSTGQTSCGLQQRTRNGYGKELQAVRSRHRTSCVCAPTVSHTQ